MSAPALQPAPAGYSPVPSPKSSLRPLILTLLAVLLATLFRTTIGRSLFIHLPFAVFAPAVVSAAWYGGRRCGILATAASMLVGWVAFVEPAGEIVKGTGMDYLRLAAFAVAGAMMTVIGELSMRVRTEAAKHEHRVRRIFENAAVGMAEVAGDGRWIEANNRTRDLLGVPSDDLKQMTCFDCVDRSDRELLRTMLEEARTGVHGSREIRFRRPDRSLRWVELSASAAYGVGEKSETAIVVLKDVTEQKQAQQEAALLLALVEAAPDFIAVASFGSGRLRYVNARGRRMVGIRRDADIQSFFHHQFCPPSTHERLSGEWLPRALECGTAEGEGVLQTLDGREIPVSVALIVHRDPTGAPDSISIIARDMSDRRRIEQNLLRYNEELEQFAWAAAHDLKEPLRTISLYTQVLQRRLKGQQDSEVNEYVSLLRSSADRMQSLIDDLFSYTSALSENETPTTDVDSGAVLDQVLSSLQPLLDSADAQVSVAELPSVRIQQGQLVRLFQNLIENAVKYRSPERKLTISVSCERDGEFCVFSVADNGLGIAAEHQERVFLAFRRLHGQEIAGSGIGLAICRRVVEAQGGRIWIESDGCTGSCFRFTLPASAQA